MPIAVMNYPNYMLDKSPLKSSFPRVFTEFIKGSIFSKHFICRDRRDVWVVIGDTIVPYFHELLLY